MHLYDAPLPRTATRKVKRDEVRAILERIVAAHDARPRTASRRAPVRVAIAAVKGDRARGGRPHDASLQGELGFDSLMLTELLEALEARFGAHRPAALQACRTVADVEDLYERVRDTQPRAPARSPRGARAPRARPSCCREPVQEAGKALVGKLQDFFYGEMMKPRVLGRAHIPHNRNVIVVANHASHLDMGFVRHALGKYGEDIVSLAAQDYFFENGIKRAFFENLTNLKAIDRKASLRAGHPAGERGHRARQDGARLPRGDAQRRAARSRSSSRWSATSRSRTASTSCPIYPRRHARGDAQGRRAPDAARDRRRASARRSASTDLRRLHGGHVRGRRGARGGAHRARGACSRWPTDRCSTSTRRREDGRAGSRCASTRS